MFCCHLLSVSRPDKGTSLLFLLQGEVLFLTRPNNYQGNLLTLIEFEVQGTDTVLRDARVVGGPGWRRSGGTLNPEGPLGTLVLRVRRSTRQYSRKQRLTLRVQKTIVVTSTLTE